MTKKKKEELLNELSPSTLHAAMKAALEDNEEIDDGDDTEEGIAANTKRRSKNNRTAAMAAAKLGIPKEKIDALGDNFVTHRGLKGVDAKVWANEEVLGLFEAINDDNAVSIKERFDSIIRNRIADRLEEAKVEVAYRGTILEDDEPEFELSGFSDEQLEDILNMDDEELAEILAESDMVIESFIENVQQLDEISPGTLHSALGKALEDNLEIDDDPDDDEDTKAANAKRRKKNNYVAGMAAAKLNVDPEKFEQKFGDAHPGLKGMIARVSANEEVEDDSHGPFDGLNEISRARLLSYIDKAEMNKAKNSKKLDTIQYTKSRDGARQQLNRENKNRTIGMSIANSKLYPARVLAKEENLSEEKKYWAHYGKDGSKKIGPFASRDDAIKAGHAKSPNISTGYGEYGGHFDIRWHSTDPIEKRLTRGIMDKISRRKGNK